MHKLIQKYGKEMMKEILDFMLIRKNLVSVDFRNLLIKYEIIKASTKVVRTHMSETYNYGRTEDGRYGKLGIRGYNLTAKNGRGQTILFFEIGVDEIPQLLEEINNA